METGWNVIESSIGNLDFAIGYLQAMIDMGTSPKELRCNKVTSLRKNKSRPEKAKKVVK